MEPCPECYGKPKDGDAGCLACRWLGSCRVYARLPPAEPRPLPRHVSYEAMTGGEGLGAAESPAEILAEAEERSAKVFSVDDLAVLTRLLLSLDDYELRIMLQVVRGRHTSLASLARVFGVTRQAMHRKLADACWRHPELAALLEAHLRRCRRVLACRKARPNQRVTDDRQMTFDFGRTTP